MVAQTLQITALISTIYGVAVVSSGDAATFEQAGRIHLSVG